jgi:c-di-GMP-binding flagellar brake protein YcgR
MMDKRVSGIQPSRFAKTVLTLQWLVFPVIAESLIEQIGWKGATAQIIFIVLIFLATFILLMVALYFRSQLKIKNEQATVSQKLFDDHAIKSDLYPLEVKRLRSLLTHEMIPHPHTIFQSAALFERCIDAEVRLMLLTHNSLESLDDDEMILSSIRKKLGFSYLPLEHPLLSTRNLEIGQSVSIFKTTGKQPLIHHAIVVSNKETYFRLQWDVDKEDGIQFFSGQEIKLAFARQGDGVYGIEVELFRTAPPSTIDCLHTLKFKRNQLRQFVRIEVNLPLRVRLIPKEKPAGEELFPKHVEGKLSDLSGGGLSFLYEKPFVPGDQVSMQFTLTTGRFSGINGKVLRVSLQEGKHSTWYRHHIQFNSLDQSVRDKIVKFIFEKQRQQNQMR